MNHVLVIGAGPAGLMAAEVLAMAGVRVTVTEAMPSVGRKFQMAGKSGLNLTKAEEPDAFAAAFDPRPLQLARAVADFGPDAVMTWAEGLGVPLFTGSTGRVFPVAMKASPLLRAWLHRLGKMGVSILTRHRWVGWNAAEVLFDTPSGRIGILPDATILALGGASWRRLGSDGAWAAHLPGLTAPFRPANCGFAVNWTDHMAPYFGKPVKSTLLKAGDATSRGEWVITRRGIEGGGVYEVSAAVRDGAALMLDLIPNLSEAELQARYAKRRAKATLSHFLKHGMRLPQVKVALFHEMSKGQAVVDVATALKRLPVPVADPLPLDTAISTAGGVRFDVLDDNLMLRSRPGTFCAGEMLDWEAPTGGYLISGCLATGRAAALGVLVHLQQPSVSDLARTRADDPSLRA